MPTRLTKQVLADAVMLSSQDTKYHRPKYMQGLRLFSGSTSLGGVVNTLKLSISKGTRIAGPGNFVCLDMGQFVCQEGAGI